MKGEVKGEAPRPALKAASSSAQNRSSLAVREPRHLSLRDRKVWCRQHGHDPLAGHPAVKMHRQNLMIKVRAAAADNPRRRIGRDPARPASESAREGQVSPRV
jgi:hypothetical protein